MDNYKAYAAGFIGNYTLVPVVAEEMISFALGVQDSRGYGLEAPSALKTFKEFSEVLNRFIAK